MVDFFPPPLRRDGARLPFDIEASYPTSTIPCSARSRRSSVSSFAESEVSVFSDASITSSHTSASTHLSSGWESSTPYDSDDENYSSLYEDISESEARVALSGVVRNHTANAKKDEISLVQAEKALPTQSYHQSDNAGSSSSAPINPRSATDSQPTTVHPSQNLPVGITEHGKPTPRSQCLLAASCHPRRTTVDASWSKPTLVTQHERRVNFVENLVGKPEIHNYLTARYVLGLINPFLHLTDSAAQLVALIWPLAMTEVCNSGRQPGTPVITLRFFIRETLRRSRTSFSTLQVAMYYLALLNYGGQIPKCDRSSNQALHCGRQMFLASLILASKYLQDRNYFTKAWSRISNLSVAEINRNEMALLSALEYKLHIRPCDFQKWTDGISRCTGAVQRGVECPWVEVLMTQHMWRPMASDAKSTPQAHLGQQAMSPNSMAGSEAYPRPANIPEHRLGLVGIGKTVCPTKPFPVPVRSCSTIQSNMQWQGMAAHLQPRPAAAPSTNLTQGVSQMLLQEDASPAEHGDLESQSSLLSPPKTPESGQAAETTGPPPTPKEPLISLNTTPDSNDGVSTFGNYLGPPSENSPSDSDSDGAKPVSIPQPSVARFKADTLDAGIETGLEVKSVGQSSFNSLESNSPHVERVSSSSSMDEGFQRGIAAAVRAEFESSDSYMDVVVDSKNSRINTCVQERTRHLLNNRCKERHASKHAVVEDEEVDGSSYRSDLKCRRSAKHEKCQRRKRPAGSFSGDHGLSLRTKKMLRS